MITLRGYCTPNLKLGSVANLKIINTFFEK